MPETCHVDHCSTHAETIAAMAQMKEATSGVIRSMNRVYGASLALIGIAILAIFYAGALHQRVAHSENEIAEIKTEIRSIHRGVMP